MSIERQCEENLPWNALKRQARDISKPEFCVVLRMPNEATSLRTHGFQTGQSFLYQRFANALSLVRRKDRNRPKTVPVWGAIRHDHGRKGDMPYHPVIGFCNQRYRKRMSGAQRGGVATKYLPNYLAWMRISEWYKGDLKPEYFVISGLGRQLINC